MDKSCPDINIKNEFYVEQLRNHMFINIYKDGKWGTIVRNIIDKPNINMSMENNNPAHIDTIRYVRKSIIPIPIGIIMMK